MTVLFNRSMGRMLVKAVLVALLCLALHQPWLEGPASLSFPLPPSRTAGPELADYPNLHSYDLGTITLTQTDVPAPVQTMPLPLNGVIGMPPGEGPF
ncbi:MAG: hypothetical protein HC922_09625, partial [Leptolyngbyaceae cyanobacterium SM2_3_12]|nr:hypothetical protein [Leptolyngbyaceae cyanobacterium SM2_3_12]